MKIGILAPGITPDELLADFGSYADMVSQLLTSVGDRPVDFLTFDVRDGQFPDSLSECDAWVITGSKYCVGQQLPWMAELKRLILNIYAKNMPLVGICFGHQIVAEAMGGRVGEYSGGWGVGLHQYRLTNSLAVSTGQDAITLNAMHKDQVLDKPKDALVLAESEFCQYAMLAYSDQMLTIQAHPEFSMVFEYLLVEARKGDVIPADIANKGLHALRDACRKTDSALVASLMIDFLTRDNAFLEC